MQYTGTTFTDQFESCRLVAFWDALGECWTIGWGRTYDVHEGDTCTQEQADEWRDKDLEIAAACVNASLATEISAGGVNQGEFNAFTDFVYNVGCPRWRGSTMLRLFKAGNISGAAAEFPKWKYASGKVVEGLLRRRLAEEAEFKGENGNSTVS